MYWKICHTVDKSLTKNENQYKGDCGLQLCEKLLLFRVKNIQYDPKDVTGGAIIGYV